LFYGPNGSGKTSFCEGLEYSLLGAVEEADTRRIDARTYLANVHANRFEAPALEATDHQNRTVPVRASADTYRFCFIEKNRKEPGLRDLCCALRKRLNDVTTFNHANKPILLAAYSRILGIPNDNLVWTYLNKGTHEEANRDDFDAALVESVVQTLEELDGLDLRAGR